MKKFNEILKKAIFINNKKGLYNNLFFEKIEGEENPVMFFERRLIEENLEPNRENMNNCLGLVENILHDERFQANECIWNEMDKIINNLPIEEKQKVIVEMKEAELIKDGFEIRDGLFEIEVDAPFGIEDLWDIFNDKELKELGFPNEKEHELYYNPNNYSWNDIRTMLSQMDIEELEEHFQDFLKENVRQVKGGHGN